MTANETKLQAILEGTKQYVVPLFQRPYTWGKKDWETLWKDISELNEAEKTRSHFIGSIVTMPTNSVPEGVSKYLLIDGQQRLTTIFILLAVLRDIARQNGEQEVANEINDTLLVNPYKRDLDHFKLLPTQGDRDLFKALVQAQQSTSASPLADAYQFFTRKILASRISHETLKTIITNGLSIVSIVLDPDDNPYLVFESLNAKGRPLTQADLIRNYFFMRIHPDEQDEAHAKYWKPMQDAMGENLTEFIRHYLMKDGATVKQSDIYAALKEQVGRSDVNSHLKELARYADYYEKLVYPGREKSEIISRGIERLNRFEVRTAYPFLLNCYSEYGTGSMSEAEFGDVLHVVENFVIRRYICNVPTNQLARTFAPLYGQVKVKEGVPFVEALKAVLQGRGYPKDAEFKRWLVEGRLYGSGDRTPKAKLILESIEESFRHKEPVDTSSLTIEHVMPQTLTPEWKEYLGEEADLTHELALHTLGNLTLTGYNPDMSNNLYTDKKAHLIGSHLEMNRYFEQIENWNGAAIEQRSRELADVLIDFWKYFGTEAASSPAADGVTGTIPESLVVLGQKLPVVTWRDVLTETLNTIAFLEPEKFAELESGFPSVITRDPSRLREARKLRNDAFVEVHLSAKSIHRLCLQVLDATDITSDEWALTFKDAGIGEAV